MTKEFNITNYPCAGGGCLLTDKEFAAKLSDLFEHQKRVTIKEVNQLKVGRHFRFGKNKIIVGRNQSENDVLMQTKQKGEYYFEVPTCGSPVTILKGPKTAEAIACAAGLTAYHSDKKKGEVTVEFGTEKLQRQVMVIVPSQVEVEQLRVNG
jgi:tRNA-uridine 2-sulfurtransferase